MEEPARRNAVYHLDLDPVTKGKSLRDGPTGRRAGLIGGPDIWEVVAGMLGGDVAPDERIDRTIELYGLRSQQVEAALGYYAEFSDEIDVQIATNADAAEEGERLWQRRRDLLAQ